MSYQKQSLSDRVVATLLKDLAAGTYPELLPSERSLAASMKVSRPVIRTALQVLEKQGWVNTVERSKSRRVVKRPELATAPARPKCVGILIYKPFEKLAADDAVGLSDFAQRCAGLGWGCVFHPVGQLGPQQQRRLKEIVVSPPCDLWFDYSLSSKQEFELLREWGHPLIRLNGPQQLHRGSISFDFNAARLHALGVMLRAGRRNIVRPCVRRNPEVSATIKAVMEEHGIRFREDFHYPEFEDTRNGFLRLMENLFASQPRPDSIILTYTSAVQVILLQGWLMKQQLSYPEDLSVIQIGSDPFLDMMYPSVSHYTTPAKTLSEAMFAATRRFFESGELLQEGLLLPVEYVKGESV